MLLQLAFRNLRRNLRRTLITSAAVGVGMVVLILSNTLRAGQYDDMIDSSVSQLAGHCGRSASRLSEGARDGTRRQRAGCTCDCTRTGTAGCNHYQPYSFGWNLGIVEFPQCQLNAVDPQSENVVSDLPDKLVEGTWVRDDTKSIVIGQNMAELLH